ncbi:MAG: septum formation protein Maf [Proteobacteria bacterium]|nr:septum formation protein Maf [Pseudomonadota bacterium]
MDPVSKVEPRDKTAPSLSSSLVLASASSARILMLERAGIRCETEAARIDEEEYRNAMRAAGAPASAVVEKLAELKARRVARHHPEAIVIGADQILDCDGVWFDKPLDLDRARADLVALRGRTHELLSCACVVQDDRRLWHHIDRAKLTMRDFTDEFLDDYLVMAGDDVLASVGAYQIEGPGAQLFSKIEGDHFTILGLPLLPLLQYLRDLGQVKP